MRRRRRLEQRHQPDRRRPRSQHQLDAELRVRREQELTAGSATVDAIRAAILREHTDTVISVLVLEHERRHGERHASAIEAIVWAPGIDGDALRTIWDAKPGHQAHGEEIAEVVDDSGVITRCAIRSRSPSTLGPRDARVLRPVGGDETFVARFVQLATDYYTIGRDVKRSRLVSFCHRIGGVFGAAHRSDDGVTWNTLDRVIEYRESPASTRAAHPSFQRRRSE